MVNTILLCRKLCKLSGHFHKVPLLSVQLPLESISLLTVLLLEMAF